MRANAVLRFVALVANFGLTLVGCSGQLDHQGPGVEPAGDAGSGDGAVDAGWTACSSPEGYRVCGGDSGCNADSEDCIECFAKTKGDFGICGLGWGDMPMCFTPEDGSICIDLMGISNFVIVQPDAAVLFAEHGFSNRIRYADLGLWTGEPLPESSDCPDVPDARLCGPGCGACQADEICTGRSQLHPHGVCAPSYPDGDVMACSVGPGASACPAGFGCFTWIVQPEAQADADGYSRCLPVAQCLAAVKVPGGGKCSI